MDNLDLISDDELRRRLMQYGFPNLPVTSTSRKLLIKKLRNYMDNEKLKLRRQTTNATRYSSDEEQSDRESRKRNHRTTIASSTVGKTTHLNSYNNQQQHNSMPPPIMPPKKPAQSYYNRTATSSIGLNSTGNIRLSNNSPTNSSVYISPVLQSTTDTEDEYDFNSENHSNGPSKLSSKTFLSNNNRNNKEYSKSFYGGRFPLSAKRSCSAYGGDDMIGGASSSSNSSETSFHRSYNGSLTSPQISTNSNGQHSPSSSDGQFLNDFTRRLLNLRGTTLIESKSRPSSQSSIRTPTNRTTYFKDSFDGDGHQSEYTFDRTITNFNTSNHYSMPINTAANVKHFFLKLNEQYGVKQTFVPCLLLSGLIVFFAFVALMYMTISPDLGNMITSKSAIYSVCEPSSSIGLTTNDLIVGVACLEKSHLDTALILLQQTAMELQKRTEHHKCVDIKAPYMLGAKDIINMALGNNPTMHILSAMKDLHNMEYLIHMNPQWHIRHIDSNGNSIDIRQVAQLRSTQENHFLLVNPRLPLLCSIYNKLQTFFFVIGGLSIVAIVIYIGFIVYCFVIGRYYARKEKVNILITDIINALIEKSASDPGNVQSNLIVVNHLRDKLIPPIDRRKMDWAWQAAIDFLEQNESRVQFEIGIRNGEDCKMMRWIDSASHLGTSLNSSGNATISTHQQPMVIKRWQSPAFDKTNKVQDPPTPCLKIRQMFHSDENHNTNLKQIVQDAILEKVGADCKIYDIELDRNSCCVYVRCATPADAGLVHDRINGWWFDSSLVSIKFLRLDRYLSRFPKSKNGPAYLRPSNTKNLSMSNCWNDCRTSKNGQNDDDDDYVDNGGENCYNNYDHGGGGGSENDS